MKIFDFKKILPYFSKDKDWQIIIVLFAIFLAAIIAINAYIFFKIEKDIRQPINVEVEAQTLKRDLLNRVLSSILEKEKQFNQNLQVKPVISDPSL